jgi:rare lipoprotein A
MIAKASVRIGSSVAGFALSALMGLIAPAAAETFEDRWSIIPKAKAEPAPQPAQAAPAPAGQAGDTGSPASRTQKKSFSGRASFYSYARGKTASGAAYNRNAMTAAHRSLPFGTKLWVTDLATNKAVTVVVTDRGPWIRGRVLDLSLEAARNLGITERGLANVRAEIL